MKIYEKVKEMVEKEGTTKALTFLKEIEKKEEVDVDQIEMLMSYNLVYKF